MTVFLIAFSGAFSGASGTFFRDAPPRAPSSDRSGRVAPSAPTSGADTGRAPNPFGTIDGRTAPIPIARRRANVPAVDTRPAPGPVLGTLTDASGWPVTGAHVRLSSGDGRYVASSLSDGLGRYALARVPPGDAYRLTVTPGGAHRRLVVGPFAIDAGGRVRDLLLERVPIGSLAGSVTDAQGRPAEGVELAVHTDAPRRGLRKVRTDADGFFAVDDVPAGALSVALDGPAFVPIRALELAAGDAAYVVIALGAEWTPLRGRVLDPTGEPAEGSGIRVRRADASAAIAWERRAFADADGRFAVYAVGRPPWTVTVSRPGSVDRVIAVETIHDTLEVHLEAAVRSPALASIATAR